MVLEEKLTTCRFRLGGSGCCPSLSTRSVALIQLPVPEHLLLRFATLLLIALLALFGTEEASLGSNAPIGYLRGA